MRRASIVRAAVFALALPFIATAAAAAPVALPMANTGFEDPITFDGAPFVGSWEGFFGSTGASAQNSGAMPNSGSQSLLLEITSSSNNFAGAFQDVAVSAGDILDFIGFHKLFGDIGGIEVRLEFRDAVANVEVGRTSNIVFTPGSTYEMFAMSGTLDDAARTVPVGADLVRVVYAIQSFGGANDQQVFIDDVSLTKESADVPLPLPGVLLASMTLVGVAAARAAGKRRSNT